MEQKIFFPAYKNCGREISITFNMYVIAFYDYLGRVYQKVPKNHGKFIKQIKRLDG